MSSFLPSEVSRLVLGYLEEVECKSAYQAFLNDCPHLAECRGRVFFTQIMGYSLVEILDDFCAAQAYLIEISEGEEFRKKVLKCKTLLEKVKLFVDNDGSTVQTPVAKCHKQTSPLVKASHSYSVHRSNRVRSNSCDSVVSTRTDVSTGVNITKRHYHAKSVESLAEATSLADLPGNKRYSTGCQTKSCGSNSVYKTIAQAFKDGLNKSFDKAIRGAKYESEEETFRSALGLIRNSDLPERHPVSTAKTPMKGKISNRKQGMSVKKIPHAPDPLPNETLDVTNITHALLDCTEFHEKLAENINKIYSNLSGTKIGDEPTNASLLHKTSTDSIVKEDNATVTEGVLHAESSTAGNHEDNNTVEDVPQLDTVIKSIVEKTERDPIFDQLINEVLAASVESSSGSDSDNISRPGTSTPEKSSYSQMNESSPTPSWRIQDGAEYPIERHSRPHFGGKKINLSYRDKLKSRQISPFKHNSYSQSQYYYRNKKYPRYPRGGKRMDVLRETYASSFCENDDDLPLPQQHKTTVTTESTTEPFSKVMKAEPKILILSDEIVNTNIKPVKGPILADNLPHKEVPHIISVSKPEETIIKPCKGNGPLSDTLTQSTPMDVDTCKYQNNPSVTLIQSFSDPRLQARQGNFNPQSNQPVVLKTLKSFEDGSATSNSVQNMVNTSHPVRFVNIEQNKTVPLLEVLPQVVNVQGNNTVPSDGSVSSQTNNISANQCSLRGFRKSIKSDSAVEKGSFYSEADIMKMPTVFMMPSNNGEDSQTFAPASTDVNVASSSTGFTAEQVTNITAQDSIDVLPNSSNIDVAPITSSHSKATVVYREKVPLKSVHGLITSMVQDTNGTHVLQIDNSLMGILPTSGERSTSGQKELIIATHSESGAQNQKAEMVSKENLGTNCVTNNTSNENLSRKSIDGKNIEQLDGKTPNDLIVQKNSGSTPRRSLSHVRVLDFNTPPKSFTETRRAHSSPKMSTRSMDSSNRKPFLTPSTNSKPKSKPIKSKLFPAIAESPSDNNEVSLPVLKSEHVKVEVIASGIWDEVHGVGQILKKSGSSNEKPLNAENGNPESNPIFENLKIKPSTAVNTTEKKKIKVLKPVDKESKLTEEEIKEKEFEEEAAAIEWARIRNANKKSWDHEMRLMLASPAPVRESFSKVKKKRKITNTRNVCINLDESDEMSKSTEDEGRLLENALNKTTGLTPAKLSEDNEKITDSIRDDTKTETVEEQIDDNLHSENNSSQGEIKSDETNNKGYLLQVKLFRDSMKTQNAEACKFVKYANPHVSNIQSSTKKQKKTSKGKNAFKVKFTPKNSKNHYDDSDLDNEYIEVVDDDLSQECKPDVDEVPKIVDSDVQDSGNKNVKFEETVPDVSAPAINNDQQQDATKKEILFTPVEPPVPSVKITPDMPREHDYNPLNAKCNLNLLLETPFKFEILDLHMDTPKFISPGFFRNSFSSIKISDIPTPSFPFLPELTKTPTSMGKEPTPGSYSSRPTDYSSSSSYYKPDEIEFNLDIKAQMSVPKSSPKNLSVLKEESESSPGSEEVSHRVLRPRRSKTIYYPDTVVKNKNDKNDSINKSVNKSSDKINTSKSKIPLKENIPKVQSKANILPKSASNKSLTEISANSAKKNTSKFIDDLNLSTSSSSSESFMDDSSEKIKKKIHSTSTPNMNSEKRRTEETRKQLEEKRNRVLTKLKKATTVKKLTHQKTKVSIKCRRIPNKLSLARTSISPKVAPVKINKPTNSSVGQEEENKEDTIVAAKENSAPVQVVKTISSKSRRKSSTPRKLMQSEIGSLTSPSESISDGDQQSEKITTKNDENIDVVTSKKVDSKESVIADEKELHISKNIEKALSEDSRNLDVCENLSKSSNETSQAKSNVREIVPELSEENTNSNIDVGDEEYVSLHLSSDEVEIESNIKDPLSISPKEANDSYITQIKEFIATTTSKKIDNTAFRENLLKQGYDKTSAAAIELELIGAPSSDNVFRTNNEDVSDVKKQKSGSDFKETRENELKDLFKYCKENPDDNKATKVDEKRSKKSSKYTSKDKDKESSNESRKSYKDKSRDKPTTSTKTSQKSPDTKKSSKSSSQKSSSMLMLPECKERRNSDSSKVQKKEKERRKSDSGQKDKNYRDKINEKVEKVTGLESNTYQVPEHGSEENKTAKQLQQVHSVVEKSIDEDVPCKQTAVQEPMLTDDQVEEAEDVVVWSACENTSTSNNFITYKFVLPNARRKVPKPVDISHYKIKATVFNSLTDEEEVREIKISENVELLCIPGDKLKLQRYRRRDAKLKQESEEIAKKSKSVAKNPLEKLFDEMGESQSSVNSLEEIHDPKTIAETNMAVKSILVEESSNNAFFCSPSKYNSDPNSTNVHMASVCDVLKKNIIDDKTPDKIEDNTTNVTEVPSNDTALHMKLSDSVKEKHESLSESETKTKTSLQHPVTCKTVEITGECRSIVTDVKKDLFNLSGESISPVKNDSAVPSVPSTEDLMNFAVVKSVNMNKVFKISEPENNASTAGNNITGTAEKRKREDSIDSDDSLAKKNKLRSPQSLLKKIDIDAVLSKLHGPE